jgi:hypothetical protein
VRLYKNQIKKTQQSKPNFAVVHAIKAEPNAFLTSILVEGELSADKFHRVTPEERVPGNH